MKKSWTGVSSPAADDTESFMDYQALRDPVIGMNNEEVDNEGDRISLFQSPVEITFNDVHDSFGHPNFNEAVVQPFNYQEIDGNVVEENLLNQFLYCTIAKEPRRAEKKLDTSNNGNLIEPGEQLQQASLLQPASTRSSSLIGMYRAALVMVTLIAAMTFTASFRIPLVHDDSNNASKLFDEMPRPESLPFLSLAKVLFPNFFFRDASFAFQERHSVFLKEDISYMAGSSKQFEALISPLFLFSCIAFFMSVALIMILTNGLSIKPWMFVLVSSISGAYTCLIMAASPGLFVTVFITGCCILLAACILAIEINLQFLNEHENQRHQPSILETNSKTSKSQNGRYQAALITATTLAMMTFHMPPRLIAFHNESNSTFQVEKHDAVINHLFVLFNSTAFFTSLALITILTHELPIKPWLIVSLSSTIGAFMCSIKAVSPHQFVPVLYIGSSILLVAFLKCLDVPKKVLDYLGWMCNRIQVI